MNLKLRSDMTVKLIEHMGNDASIVASARVSVQGAESERYFHYPLTEGDEKLINFLMKNRHGTPFEHNSMTFYIEAPIFVFREFHRHRIGWSYNEMSGRYKELEPVFYVPGPDRPLVQVGKPGHYTFEQGTDDQRVLVREATESAYEEAWAEYRYMLINGVAKEVARTVLPVGIYSSMYATCNARSLMHFLSLRTKSPDYAKFPSYPQEEIHMVADEMETLFAQCFKVTYNAYNENGRVAP